jgi:hypothetical protein
MTDAIESNKALFKPSLVAHACAICATTACENCSSANSKGSFSAEAGSGADLSVGGRFDFLLRGAFLRGAGFL